VQAKFFVLRRKAFIFRKECIFLLKESVFDRLLDAGFRIRKKSRKASSREALFGSSSVIDADFVEVDENFFRDPNSSHELNSGSIDSELLEKLREYLRTRSEEEISEIFEEVRKILESRGSESDFHKTSGEEIPFNQRARIKKVSKNAFKVFLETASYGRECVVNASKVASSKASSIASEGKESIVDSSKKLNEKWNNLSPRDRKIISELMVAMIEIGLLKGASRSKQAAFAVLSSISRRQTPSRKDLEDFGEGLQKLFKRRR
jgi:predicted house-cleaning noncanonical NTP pyrophosphatase (MazG superfamily)